MFKVREFEADFIPGQVPMVKACAPVTGEQAPSTAVPGGFPLQQGAL
jgi:hypothetical protein